MFDDPLFILVAIAVLVVLVILMIGIGAFGERRRLQPQARQPDHALAGRGAGGGDPDHPDRGGDPQGAGLEKTSPAWTLAAISAMSPWGHLATAENA